METDNSVNTSYSIPELRDFFNTHHDKIVATVNADDEPNLSLMGTPRMNEEGIIELELTDLVSITLQNLEANKHAVFMVYAQGERARDYTGARIYADVKDIFKSGEQYEKVRNSIKEKFGEAKASELNATVQFSITSVRPIVDRGQRWNETPIIAG